MQNSILYDGFSRGSKVLDYCTFFNNFMMANRMASCTAVGMKMKHCPSESSLFSKIVQHLGTVLDVCYNGMCR